MTDEQKAAYVYSQATAALIEAMGMVAENQLRDSKGEAQAYGEKSFFELPYTYNLYHNSVVSLFHGI